MSAGAAVDRELSVVNELDRLVELRERGHVSPAEYDEAKQQLLGASWRAAGAAHSGIPAPDGAYLLYRLMASWLRRVAAAMAVVALLFGLVAGWSGLRYLDVNAQAEAVNDVAIAQGFGVRIPDPRPTIDRAVLETKATAYGGLAAMTGVIALGTLAGALFVRPPRRPRGTEGADHYRDEHRSVHQAERGA
ncbi:MAG: SHOCT domain-containing protein [Pseudonocardiales bacterium]